MTLLRVGKSKVVAAGSVVLGADDSEFEITVEGLTYIIAFVNEEGRPSIFSDRVGPSTVRISYNNPNPLGGFSKFRVGTVGSFELHLAMYWTSGEKNHFVSYTFSVKGTAQ
jgi:hypothetical protein